MRTTLTLDDDLAGKLKTEARRSGRSFKELVNEYLRLGLNAKRQRTPARAFEVHARPMGLRQGLSYDNIGELLERIEGPDAR